MSSKSKIEWTDVTWNPVTGCTPVSDGCRNCYAIRMAKRLQAMGVKRYRNGFHVTLQDDQLDTPLRWKKPRMVFVNSMGDLFHEDIPFEYVKRVFAVMKQTPQHTYQVLTKRSTRMVELAKHLAWPANIWLGVTIESGKYSYRAQNLLKTAASTKFLSIEPMIGAVEGINLEGIDWVIVGGESGPQARAIRREWAVAVRDNCISNNIPFFFKQWGGPNKKKTGRLLDGQLWNQFPAGAR